MRGTVLYLLLSLFVVFAAGSPEPKPKPQFYGGVPYGGYGGGYGGGYRPVGYGAGYGAPGYGF
jgi:hypothetical protein